MVSMINCSGGLYVPSKNVKVYISFCILVSKLSEDFSSVTIKFHKTNVSAFLQRCLTFLVVTKRSLLKNLLTSY